MALIPVKNESELLVKIAGGCETAFAELFYAYHNQIGEFVLLITGSREMTEEIVGDVFLKIWLKREDLPGIQKFTSYLFILTRNYTLNSLRKANATRKHVALYKEARTFPQEHLHADMEPETEPDYHSLLEHAVAKLPPQQQKVFRLKQQGLKNAEIAEQLSIHPQSVKKYQQWALRTLSKYVAGLSFQLWLLWMFGIL